MEETPGDNPTDALASPFPVVVDDGDGTAALRELSAPSATTAASPDIVGTSTRPPPVPRRRAFEPPILLDDEDPPTPMQRPRISPGLPGSVAPDIPQSLGSRAAVAVESDSLLPPSLPVNASGSGIHGSAVPGSIGPDIAAVAAGTPPFATSSSAGSSSAPASSSAASAHNLPGASSLMSLANGNVSESDNLELARHALKLIVVEIDSKIIESGTIKGTLLKRFAEKGLQYRVTANTFRGSILWKMEVPQIGQDPALVSEVPYILFVLQGEEFYNLISSGAFLDHVRTVQSHYPTFTVCYVTNKLIDYMHTRERSRYLNPDGPIFWRDPPVEEEGLCKIATHYARVHSRQCVDEAEVADHVVGLTSSLANCKFRKPLTWLSVHANGVRIPQIIINKGPSRNDTWMKSLIAIPRVLPKYALAIWKKYGTMRSLLNAYMDPSKTDLEKELLLEDLKYEDSLGEETRRLGPACSRRVYKALMGQNGSAFVDPAA